MHYCVIASDVKPRIDALPLSPALLPLNDGCRCELWENGGVAAWQMKTPQAQVRARCRPHVHCPLRHVSVVRNMGEWFGVV